MSILTKKRTVLNLDQAFSDSETIYEAEYSNYEPNMPFVIVNMSGTTYDDLGQPETITVTIEPGDKLNSG